MSTPKKTTNPIILRPGTTIGSASAETDDEFLFDCFVDHDAVQVCTNFQSPGMVLSGRTGAGKTAILRYIEHKNEHLSRIDPVEMSISYVSNSDAIKFLQRIGADIDLLFQVLWKHILCLEFIRLRFHINDEQKSRNIFQRIVSKFSTDARKARAIEYLRAWEGKFWITVDQNIKEITEKIENKLDLEIGGEIQKFKSRGQYEKQLSTEKKSELVSRVQKIINAEQLRELAGVIDILGNEASDDGFLKYHILIDNLDDRWVDTSIRFRLIRALIESLKSFRKVQNLKIIVAMRSDILERVMQETGDPTFQREKFEYYFIKLKWTAPQLRDLVERRITLLFKRQYTSDSVTFADVFPYNVGQVNPFDYMIDRTMYRPRDIIAYVNECFAQAEGRCNISAKQIKEAESEYSRLRRAALEE